MSWFKKKSEVPPVDEAARNDLLGGKRPTTNSYGQGPQPPQGGNPPPSARPGSVASGRTAGPAPSYHTADPYAHRGSNMGPESSGGPAGYGQRSFRGSYQQQQDPSGNRAELFRNAKAPHERFAQGDLDNPETYQTQQQEDEDDEVEAIKQQTRFTKQESLASTRNALRAAREAEEVGRNTLTKLGDQTERLANVDRSLDMAKSYNDRAGDEAKEIAALNKSIFRPTFVWNKEKKRNAEEERIVRRHVAEQERREENRQMRAESAKNIQGNLREAEKPRSRWGGSAKAAEYGEASAQQSKMANRARYQFEADEEDDAIEDELDQNLDEIGDMSRRLNLLARAAGDEVRQQNNTLGNLNNKTDNVDQQIFRSTQRLARLK